MTFDVREVFECGAFDVVYFVRDRCVKEGTITIYGVVSALVLAFSTLT